MTKTKKPELQAAQQKQSVGKSIVSSLWKILMSISTIILLFVIWYFLFPIIEKWAIDLRWTTWVVLLILVLLSLIMIKVKKIWLWVWRISAWIFYPALILYYFLVWSYEPKNLEYDATAFNRPSWTATIMQTKDNNVWFELKDFMDKQPNQSNVPLSEKLLDGMISIHDFALQGYAEEEKQKLWLVKTESLYWKEEYSRTYVDEYGNKKPTTKIRSYLLTGEKFVQNWSWHSHNIGIWYSHLSGRLQQFTFELQSILDSWKSFQIFYADADGSNQNCNPHCAAMPYGIAVNNIQWAVRTLSTAGMYLISQGEYSQGISYFKTSLDLSQKYLNASWNAIIQWLIWVIIYEKTLDSIDATLKNFELPDVYKKQLAAMIEKQINVDEMWNNISLEEYYLFEQTLKTVKDGGVNIIPSVVSLTFDEGKTREIARYYYARMIKREEYNPYRFDELIPESWLMKNIIAHFVREISFEQDFAPFVIKNRVWLNVIVNMMPRMDWLYERIESLEQLRSSVYTELTK